jgi:CheY-like chemotaxis protein
MLRRSLGPEIRIGIDFERGLAPVRVDPNQLELAILNLALNARDAIAGGGELSIAGRRERLGAGAVGGLRAGDYIRLAVGDTGVGMDEATLKRATEPFFTTKERGRGTGLGLSMVDGLVAQSGGAMRISSRVGVGTTIELWLPVAPSRGTTRPRRAAPAPRASGTRSFLVLVVDDDPIVGASTAAMLEDLGHRTIEAASAQRALDALQLEPGIEIVITDHAMPGMTGTELALRIRETRPELPVVLSSGYAELPNGHTSDLPRLAKPYRQQELAALIASLVGAPRNTPRPSDDTLRVSA